MNIDFEALRKDLMDECMAAFFGAGIGPALIDESDIEEASEDELIEIAEQFGVDLSDYDLF